MDGKSLVSRTLRSLPAAILAVGLALAVRAVFLEPLGTRAHLDHLLPRGDPRSPGHRLPWRIARHRSSAASRSHGSGRRWVTRRSSSPGPTGSSWRSSSPSASSSRRSPRPCAVHERSRQGRQGRPAGAGTGASRLPRRHPEPRLPQGPREPLAAGQPGRPGRGRAERGGGDRQGGPRVPRRRGAPPPSGGTTCRSSPRARPRSSRSPSRRRPAFASTSPPRFPTGTPKGGSWGSSRARWTSPSASAPRRSSPSSRSPSSRGAESASSRTWRASWPGCSTCTSSASTGWRGTASPRRRSPSGATGPSRTTCPTP